MTPTEARSEIARLVVALLDANAVIDVNTATLRRRGNDTLVTWPAAGDTSLSDQVFASLQEYRRFVIDRQYTALLTDGALIQISYTFNQNEVVAQRFCYYPCPLIINPGDLESDFPELFDLYLLEELDSQKSNLSDAAIADPSLRLRLRGPMRFEYDIRNAGPGHAASHLHVLLEDSHWPIFGPLSIGHFVRFVFRRFYVSDDLALLRDWPITHQNRTVRPDEEIELFIECRQQL
jgi:hypothetical protein